MTRSGAATRAAAAAVGLALLAPAAAASAPGWRLEQPPPPPGARFKVPLGPPGDMQFWSRSRGLLAVEGNAAVPRGLFAWNGERWRQLSTVCGGAGDTARIAWAGPREFWTITAPSRPRVGNGTALCRFKDGEVVASYSTPDQSPDPYRQMDAASCSGPNDCWFGGFGAESPNGDRRGAFHLHWNGSSLRTVYAPQGRGVTDIEHLGGVFYETTLVGPRPEDRDNPPFLAQPETTPALIHRLSGGSFANDPFRPAERPDVPADGTELLALDAASSRLWAAGGGAASGPSAPEGGAVERTPLIAWLDGGTFREVPTDDPRWDPTDRAVDVAAVPEAPEAWAAIEPYAQRRSVNREAKVARFDASGVREVITLPSSGSGRGTAAKIAFAAPNDGWMVTHAGWLFHYTDGSRPPVDTDPAFDRTIDFRPNESAEQFVPDTPPRDDSLLFAPPVEVEPPPSPEPPPVQLPALLKRVKTRVRGTRLVVSFTLVRRARVQLIARRKGRTVARTRARSLRPGRHKLTLRLKRKRWPTRITFRVREPGVDPDGQDANTVTTPKAP